MPSIGQGSTRLDPGAATRTWYRSTSSKLSEPQFPSLSVVGDGTSWHSSGGDRHHARCLQLAKVCGLKFCYLESRSSTTWTSSPGNVEKKTFSGFILNS